MHKYFNARKGRAGHLWRNPFYSCPLDGHHLRAAPRYVERNPVRAGLAPEAGAWAWSSAAAHLGQAQPLPGLDLAFWQDSGGAERWREPLAGPDGEAWLAGFRRPTYAGNPVGTDEFAARVKAGQAVPDDLPAAPTPTKVATAGS